MTTALLACETVLVAVLSVLVVGLLRSHAEILRRLGPPDAAGASPAAVPPPERPDARPAQDVSGSNLDGDAVQIGLGPGSASTLLAFLSSGCSVCGRFWEAFKPDRRAPLPGGARLAIVVKDSSHERPSRLRELDPGDVPLVLSSAAWRDYDIPTTPYFVYVDGPSGRVYGEGAAGSWEQVESLLRDSLDDIAAFAGDGAAEQEAAAPVGNGSGAVHAGAAERALRAELELERAGIGPGHPSLYPSGNGERAAG